MHDVCDLPHWGSSSLLGRDDCWPPPSDAGWRPWERCPSIHPSVVGWLTASPDHSEGCLHQTSPPPYQAPVTPHKPFTKLNHISKRCWDKWERIGVGVFTLKSIVAKQDLKQEQTYFWGYCILKILTSSQFLISSRNNLSVASSGDFWKCPSFVLQNNSQNKH